MNMRRRTAGTEKKGGLYIKHKEKCRNCKTKTTKTRGVSRGCKRKRHRHRRTTKTNETRRPRTKRRTKNKEQGWTKEGDNRRKVRDSPPNA